MRGVPITPRLMVFLMEHHDGHGGDHAHLITLRGGGAVHRRVLSICEQAGVELWPATTGNYWSLYPFTVLRRVGEWWF